MKRINPKKPLNKFYIALNYFLHMAVFAATFAVIGYYIPRLYFQYFDTKIYYKIFSPMPIEHKTYKPCEYVDAYIHRVALVPIKGSSVRQLTLLRVDNGMKQRIKNYKTDFQANIGEETVITHWELPCNLPKGRYIFEGTAEYYINGIQKFTHFYTDQFIII